MAENTSSRKGHGVARVLAKLETSVNSGNYYEAHQMYRTIYFRYLQQERYIELLQMLYDGATLLLRHNQRASGADLALLYVDVLVKSSSEPTDQLIVNLAELFTLMGQEVVERQVYLFQAIQWSSKDHKSGHPQLHQLVARTFWKEKNYSMARRHFLLSKDGLGFATMLVELHRSYGYTTEVDLFIAQVVLQFLCLQNKSTAVLAFESYTMQHPVIKGNGPPYLLPLLNFIWFLFKAIDSGRVGVFTVLCEEYQVSIKRDPSYTDYLDKIGQIFFGVPPPRIGSRSGFLGNLLESLINGVDELSEEEEPAPPPNLD